MKIYKWKISERLKIVFPGLHLPLNLRSYKFSNTVLCWLIANANSLIKSMFRECITESIILFATTTTWI